MNVPYNDAIFIKQPGLGASVAWHQDGIVHWNKPAEKICDYSKPPFVKWFKGGETNLCYNAVDRHAARTPKKTAILWVKNDPGQYEYISYSKLEHEVGRLANVLAHPLIAGKR